MMLSDTARLAKYVLDRGSFAAAIGDHARVTVEQAAAPVLLSRTDEEVEIPAGMPVLDRLTDVAEIGAVTYLTRHGRRVAAVVPADIAESILAEPLPADDPDRPGRPTGGGRRTLDELSREQGVRMVEDPAELRGTELPDFDEFFAAAMSGRCR